MTRADSVGIVGAGRFGLALAHCIGQAGREVILWSQDARVVADISQHRQSERLAQLELPPSVRATTSPEELARAVRLVIVAVSSETVRERVQALGDFVDGSHFLVHAIGALAEPGEMRISEVLVEEAPALRVGALAGPALWRDLAGGKFSSMVAVSHFDEVTAEVRRLISVPPLLRVYRGSDVAGVELASALAGAYTIAVGMSDGLGLGPGPRAVLMTRAVAESARLGSACGARKRTFSGLAGLGNLLVRTQSEASRDYRLGLALAQQTTGPGPDKSDPGELSEGARAALAALRLARRLGIRVPLLRAIAAVLQGELSPEQAATRAADSVAIAE